MRAAVALFVPACAVAAWMVGDGAAGWLYLLLYCGAALPGLPVGFALFGRDQAAGWIAGAAIGYSLSAIALWAVIASHVLWSGAFVLAWALTSGLTFWLTGRWKMTPVPLPRWTRGATAALLLVLVLGLAIAAPPLARVGIRDEDGNRYYRAYFTADFVWHTALTAEIAKFSMPPRNPYLQGRSIHYYWTYYLFPAVVSARGPAPLQNVQRCLKLNALATGLLLISAVFVGAWSAVGQPVAVGYATALALTSSSAEGAYALYRIWRRGEPLSALRELNVDALSSWFFGGHRVDGLARCLWYVPQHGMSYALGVIALTAAVSAGSAAPASAIWLIGITLGCSVCFNPFVGAMFALTCGVAIVVDAVRHPNAAKVMLRHAIAVLPVAAAIAWCFGNQMLAGAGGAVRFGLRGGARDHPFLTLILSLGPILAVAIAGFVFSRSGSRSVLLPFMVAIVASLFTMYWVQLSVDTEWVAFRSGHLILVVIAAPVAACLAHLARQPRYVLAVVIAVALVGLPTTIIDWYNSRDIYNTLIGPGFPWTIVVTRQQDSAYRWIRENTPTLAVVQMDPTVRERSTWSNIPSFAERRMAAGLPISLLNVPEYRERSDEVAAMYGASDTVKAAEIARRLGINYVYVDEVERTAHAGALAFEGSPYFQKVFDAPPVAVYLVR